MWPTAPSIITTMPESNASNTALAATTRPKPPSSRECALPLMTTEGLARLEDRGRAPRFKHRAGEPPRRPREPGSERNAVTTTGKLRLALRSAIAIRLKARSYFEGISATRHWTRSVFQSRTLDTSRDVTPKFPNFQSRAFPSVSRHCRRRNRITRPDAQHLAARTGRGCQLARASRGYASGRRTRSTHRCIRVVHRARGVRRSPLVRCAAPPAG